ncbi:bZIP transcription factor 27 [Elaeis guineensis]|uniref:BZIP transcription factor 27 n=1 Tax=Elaeis guineensis var. tenera TaxID=51953 RepID=A0A6J0PPX5_ELAGV|nr:bZIP transcription factor 27 [Elaeis guineensis]
MEEVWKDISLSTLQQGMEANRTTTTSFGGIIVQDLLGQAFKEPSPASAPLDDLSLPPSSSNLVGYPNPNNPHTDTNGGASPAGLFACCTKKRASEQQMEASFGSGNGNAADQRKKRLIKNREAAARSRARKQAYTQELEEEVAHLLDENRKLQYEMSLAVEAPQPTKRTLQRASTAPF